MLILTRKKGESVKIGDEIEIFITEVKGDKVRIGISAPENMKITRTELYLTVENNKEAADKVELTRNLYAANQTEENTEEPDGD